MKKNQKTDTRSVARQSLRKASKIAVPFLAFGVAWILVSDNISIQLFSNVQDVIRFAIIKGLIYITLATSLIFYLSYSNIKKIIHKSQIELEDKKRIEEQHYLLKALADTTPDLVFYKNANYEYIGCNKAFEELAGYPEAAIIGKTDYDLFDKDDADFFRNIDLEIISLRKSKNFEEQVTYPDGRTVWVDTNKAPFYDSQNQLIGLVGTSHDISLRRSLIQQLEKEKKQFEMFIDSSQDMIYLKDDQFRLLIANKALAGFFGKDIHELRGKTDAELMSGEHAEAWREADQAAIRSSLTLNAIEKMNDRIFEACRFPVAIDEERMGVGAIIRDNTIKLRQQETISHIAETNRIIAQCMTKPFANVQEQLDYALHEACNLTESQYGYIYFYNEDAQEFLLNSWTTSVKRDNKLTASHSEYLLKNAGFWGEVVRQRKAIILNDFNAPNAMKKGYPEGHLPLRRFMSLPVFENDRIVAVVGLANKNSDYSENDVQTMTVLMSGVWIATKRKEKEEETQKLLRRRQAMVNDHQAVMLLVDPQTEEIIEANQAASVFYGYSKKELLQMRIQDINMMDTEAIHTFCMRVLEKGQRYYTVPHRLKNGEIRVVDVYSSPIEYDDKKVLFSIVIDVTEREEIAQQNEYLAYHDYLTGLYNRRHFEEEYQKRLTDKEFPIGLFLGDVDGFKVFNDTYGHAEGDKVLRKIADELRMLVGRDGVLARVGGDEFAILVSGKNRLEMRAYLDRLNHENDDARNDPVVNKRATISWGYALQKEVGDTLDNLEEEAEAFMYNRKFYSHHSLRSKTVNAIMETLFTKSEREKNHSERVGLLSEAIAKHMHLSNEDVDKIRVAGFLHDIGKIGIDEAILNKEGRLTDDEWEIMKLHPAKSAGILDKTHEYQAIADIVLSHHERFDGLGYPRKIAGQHIPLEARIIAVADTYDAITNDRPYHKAMSPSAAIAVMKQNAGTQLDPEIVSILVNEVLEGMEPTLSPS